MSVTPWTLLGVDEDADAKAIRRAYARALKTTRPDQDPGGFQQLTDAYEWALGQARQREREALEAPTPPVEPDATPGPGSLPELGRPIDEPPPGPTPGDEGQAPSTSTDRAEAQGFDFGAFFDALAPMLARSPPADLHAWLEAHPDLYSIDLKWALIPHVVNTLAQHVEAISPRRANVDVLMGFLGVDARLRRHPALAPALDHIDAHLDGARRAAAAREIEDDRRSPLQMALDADTIPGEVANLEAEIRKARNGRSAIVNAAQARWLEVALRDAGRWRTLLSFAVPRRRRAAGEALRPFLAWLRRWHEAGIIPSQAATVIALCSPDHVGADSLRLGVLRLGLLGAVFVAATVGGLASEAASEAWQPAGALARIVRMVSIFAFFFVVGGLMVELVQSGLRLASPWILRQRWDLWRLMAGAAATACAWIDLLPGENTGVAMAFTGMALVAMHRPLFVLVAPFGALITMMAIARASGMQQVEDVTGTLKIGLLVATIGLLGFEHWVRERDWMACGLPPEGWRRCALSLLGIALFWWGMG